LTHKKSVSKDKNNCYNAWYYWARWKIGLKSISSSPPENGFGVNFFTVNENIFGKRLPWEDEISNHADFLCQHGI
jgi:hypothetical protein